MAQPSIHLISPQMLTKCPPWASTEQKWGHVLNDSFYVNRKDNFSSIVPTKEMNLWNFFFFPQHFEKRKPLKTVACDFWFFVTESFFPWQAVTRTWPLHSQATTRACFRPQSVVSPHCVISGGSCTLSLSQQHLQRRDENIAGGGQSGALASSTTSREQITAFPAASLASSELAATPPLFLKVWTLFSYCRRKITICTISPTGL